MNDWKMKGKPALVILHMQEGIVGKRCIFPGMDKDIELAGVIPHQQALLEGFRSNKLPVVYVNTVSNPVGILPAYGFHFKKVESYKVEPEDLKVIPQLSPKPGEPVLLNWLLSPFNNSGLNQVLKVHCVETLVLVGCTTHMAVYNTAIDAVDLFYSVIIPSDACASRKSAEKATDIVLNIMAPNVALVTTTDDVLAHL